MLATLGDIIRGTKKKKSRSLGDSGTVNSSILSGSNTTGEPLFLPVAFPATQHTYPLQQQQSSRVTCRKQAFSLLQRERGFEGLLLAAKACRASGGGGLRIPGTDGSRCRRSGGRGYVFRQAGRFSPFRQPPVRPSSGFQTSAEMKLLLCGSLVILPGLRTGGGGLQGGSLGRRARASIWKIGCRCVLGKGLAGEELTLSPSVIFRHLTQFI